MTDEASSSQDIEMIKKTVQHYIDGAITGSGETMKPAFHDEATIYGYIGEDLFAGPIQKLFDWNDENGAATDLQATISNIDLVGSTAQVKLDIDNWTGHKFTDFFNMLKLDDGSWKVMNKVFYLHS